VADRNRPIRGIVNLSKSKLFARVMPDSKPLKIHALALAGNPHSASKTCY
jgi:hypothetical protein